MKTKQIVILVIVLLVLGILTWRTRSGDNSGWRNEDSTQTILPADFDADAVKSVVLTRNGQKLTFSRTSEGWTLAERGDYPADVSQLGKIMLDLLETKIAQRFVQADANEVQSMELSPESGAVTLELLDGNNNKLVKLCFGKRVEKEADQASMAAMYGQAAGTPLGRYIQLQDGTPALVANTFSILDNAPGQWLDQEFLNIEKLKSVSLTVDGKVQWTLERKEEMKPLELACDIPKGYQPDTSALGAIDRAFSWLPFKDATLATTPLSSNKTLNITDWSGATYTIDFGEKTADGRHMRVKANYAGEDKAKKEKIEKLGALLQKYNYLVIPNTFDSVDKTLVQLCKEIPQEKKTDAPKEAKQ